MEKTITNLVLAFCIALTLTSCFKGEEGPAGAQGPAGPAGETGPRGLPGTPGTSVKAPPFSGFYRVFLQGTEPLTAKNYVDSSQYLFFSENWKFRLYKESGDSCNPINQGTVDWGANTFILTDSASHENFYEMISTTLKRTADNDLLGCAKCLLQPVSGCIFDAINGRKK
jgi:hypothetical protein